MEPGTKISHYQIAAKLGQGGMGVVYRAWDQKLQRTVALKFLSSGEKANPHAARFHQEALAVWALNHPNIARIYDIDDGEGIRSWPCNTYRAEHWNPRSISFALRANRSHWSKGLDRSEERRVGKEC